MIQNVFSFFLKRSKQRAFNFLFILRSGDKMRRLPPFHPYVFAATSALFVYLYVWIEEAPSLTIAGVVGFVLMLLFLLSLFIRRFIPDLFWGHLILTIISLTLFSVPRFFYVALIALLALSLLTFIAFKITNKSLQRAHILFLLNAASLAMLGALLWTLVQPLLVIPWTDYFEHLETARQPAQPEASVPPDELPDIYLIVLDGYGRSDILEKYYGFSNGPFLDELRAKGFVIPERSQSNYARTAFSLVALLNMDYVQNLLPDLGAISFWWLMKPLIENGKVHTTLRVAGYKTVAIATSWSLSNNSSADIYYHPKPLHFVGYPGTYIRLTPMKAFTPLFDPFAFIPNRRSHAELTNYTFDTLAQISQTPSRSPRFVFAHIVAPHPPFVFDAAGNLRDPDKPFTFFDGNDFPGDSTAYRQGYVEQLLYINTRLMETIDAILARSSRPVVLILTGDHGPGMWTNFLSADHTCLKERFSAFTALYLPGVDPSSVPDDISSVNIFRLVLNTYLGTQFSLLENRNYFNFYTLYSFEDVTDRVSLSCNGTNGQLPR